MKCQQLSLIVLHQLQPEGRRHESLGAHFVSFAGSIRQLSGNHSLLHVSIRSEQGHGFLVCCRQPCRRYDPLRDSCPQELGTRNCGEASLTPPAGCVTLALTFSTKSLRRCVRSHCMKKSVTFGQGAEAIFGTLDENLRYLESAFDVRISQAENNLVIEGPDDQVNIIERLILDYNQIRREGIVFTNGDFKSIIKIISEDSSVRLRDCFPSVKGRVCGRKTVTPRSLNQKRYLESIDKHDMVFGIGPAGTGKTYLAVAMAVAALSSKRVNRIVLARPAVEAGERLGFLPGSLQEKVDPYLRPLYDALY